MVSAEKKGDSYLVRFKGKKQQFNEYINKLMSITEKEWDSKNRCWKIPAGKIHYLTAMFKDVELLEEAGEYRAVSDFENMGMHMKLAPYNYQKEAIKFGLDNDGILIVYPCGSGKTPIGIGIYDEAKRCKKIKGPGMIVVKASLKTQWAKEIKKFSDYTPRIIKTYADITQSYADKATRRLNTLKKGTYRGKPLTQKQRKEIEAEVKQLEIDAKHAFHTQFDDCDLFVLNYETLKEEAIRKEIRKRKIEYVFADEIHYVKNHDSDRSKALHEFGDIKLRVGATATPVKKDYQDVFGIFKFVQPTLFSSFSAFAKKYIKYAGYGRIAKFINTDHLQKLIAPYIIVKTKEEVSEQLPDLMVIQRYCDMYDAQQELSDRIMMELDELNDQVKAIRARCFTKEDVENNPELMKLEARVMALQTFAQETADSPKLLSMSDSKMSKDYSISKHESAKLELMAELVEEIISSGEKVCIFTRYERMHSILQERILKIDKSMKIAKVSGGMDDKKRYVEIYDKFRDNDDYKILLGTDAMAEGANLSMCKYLIEYDLAESYAIQTQRHGRLERADSVHDTVFVYQLIANNSWDEVQVKIVSKKEGYDAELIKSLANRD